MNIETINNIATESIGRKSKLCRLQFIFLVVLDRDYGVPTAKNCSTCQKMNHTPPEAESTKVQIM